ncbi:GNAT family N-acetyltransferase [Wenzhouxiangella sp. EGI_FJ10305]|uniref:GNAT family N-acetyltransferase n=1 Tax=Wenzhouxiangella sp. EGI_FJ10305 TaxID=3243768 RepID=UPI0035E2C332
MSPGLLLKVSVIKEPEALTELEPEWRKLHAASNADLFVSWDWLIPWWQHLAGNRELFVMLARDEDGVMRGLLALSLETARVGFRRISRLRFIGDDQVGSDYLDALIEPGWKRAANQAFAAALVTRKSDWDLLELRDMDERSTTAQELLDALGDEFDMRSDEGLLCPVQDFDSGLSAADFISHTSRFKNYTRRRKWLERQPGFRIEICRDEHTLQPALEHFFRLHRLRWHDDGGSSGIAGARVEAFHRDAMSRLMASGKLRLYTLWVDGLAVASVYALIHGQTFYYYQAGMDPAWRSRSVGLVLIGETFADAIGSGLTRYDFLRGEEAYKADWVKDSRRLVSRRLFERRGRGASAVNGDVRLSHGRTLVKKWIRRYVGQRTVDTTAVPHSVHPDCQRTE